MMRFILLFWFLMGSLCAEAQIVLNVNLDSDDEKSSFFFQDRYSILRDYLSRSTNENVILTYGQDATVALQRTRSGYYGIVIGPAHVIGTAVRYGYQLVGSLPQTESIVFLV